MKLSQLYKLVFTLALIVATLSCLAGGRGVSAQRNRGGSQRPRRPASPPVARTLSPQELASYALPAVGLVVCSNGENVSQASGFFISPGLLVTNYHVIRGMTQGSIRVEIAKQKFDMRITRVLDYDDRLDLAFLWIPDAVQFKIRSLALLDSDEIRIGETIYALGNPEGLTGTFSPGIISAQERKLRDISYMQISAPVSHGSSGGPVINLRAQVVAVVVGSIEEGQNLNFAIPAKYIRSMMPEVSQIESLSITEVPDGGGWIWSKKPAEIRAKELVAKGDTLTQTGQFADAINSYSEALNLSPGLVDVKRGVGVVYEHQAAPLIDSGKYSDALRLLKQSLEIYAENYVAHFQVGRTYSLMKQEKRALEAFDNAIKLKPDFALAHYAKGLTLIGLDELDSALEEVSLLTPLDSKLAAELLEFLSKTILTSKLAILRQELQSQGTFSIPSQSNSVSMNEMIFFVPARFAGCQIAWRQSSATIATNYSSSAMTAHYTDFEVNLKDLDADRIRLDRNTSGRYYVYLPTRNGQTTIKRSSWLSLPDSRNRQNESKSSDTTSSASIGVKNREGVEDIISAFKTSATICRQIAKQ